MFRSRFATGFLLAPILFILVVSTFGCAGYSEDPLVRKFFAAARMRDNSTLANIALTNFDPKTDGQVETFSIVSETPEQVAPLTLKAKTEAFRAAQKDEKDFTDKKRAYQDANADAVKRVLEADAKGKRLGGKDGAVQAEWDKWKTETQAMAKKVSAAREAMASERPVVDLSMQNPLHPIDASDYEGVMATKDMSISANVRMPDGQSVRKNLVVTLQQARLKDDKGADIIGKWIITKITEAPAGAKS
jgi:hypothetical protein